jgi:hypothetical protein
VGDEASVERQLREVADAGATDLIAWAYPVGEDKALSLDRTWALLGGLAGEI